MVIEFEYLLLLLTFLEFIFIYLYYSFYNKKYEKITGRAINSIIEAVALNSGIALFLYLFGKVFKWEYLIDLYEGVLLLAILISCIVLIFSSIERIIEKNKI